MAISKDLTIGEIRRLPVFAPVSKYLVGGPTDPLHEFEDVTIGNWARLKFGLRYSTLDGLNYLEEVLSGGSNFFHIYSEEEIAEEPAKGDVHIIHFAPIPDVNDDGEEKPYILILAGGAFMEVWSMNEGYPVARRFNELGFHAFVLNYRTNTVGLFPKPMDDIAQAVTFIGEHAAEFGVNPERYIVNGYSAGGCITAEWGTKKNGFEKYGLPKPEALFPIYPVVNMDAKKILQEIGSHPMYQVLYGENPTEEYINSYNVDAEATENYPASYVVCCKNDPLVPYTQSVLLHDTLKKLGVPVKLEIGEYGGHGFGEGRGTYVEGWICRAAKFWRENH